MSKISIKMYLRIRSPATYIIFDYKDNRFHIILPTQSYPDNYIDFDINKKEIYDLIKKKILVATVEKKEFKVQYALGIMFGRVYKLAPAIAAKYIFSSEEQRILSDIEYLEPFFNYCLINMEGGWRLKFDDKPSDSGRPPIIFFHLNKSVVESLIARNVLIECDNYTWKLSPEYYNFAL